MLILFYFFTVYLFISREFHVYLFRNSCKHVCVLLNFLQLKKFNFINETSTNENATLQHLDVHIGLFLQQPS